jgi:hypothetical protein
MKSEPTRISIMLFKTRRRAALRPTLGATLGVCLLGLAAPLAGAQTPPPPVNPQTPPPATPLATPQTPAVAPPKAAPPANPATPPAGSPAQTPAAPPKPPAQPAAPATPQPPPTTQLALPSTAEFRHGVLYGHVLDVDGKPLPGATVALQDPKGKVVAWTKTNAQGEYALAADPMSALNLRASARRGLLEQCARAVGDVAMAPVKMAANVVVNPGQTVKSAAVSLASGTPAPLVGQVVAPVLTDKNAPKQTVQQAREAAARAAVGDGPAPKGKKPQADKGEALLLVSAPNYKEARVKAGAYWLEGPATDKAKPMGMQAWLETVKLAPTAGDKKSEIVQEAVTLSEPTLDQTLVPAGASVKIKVKLVSPPGPEHKVRVFAREAHKDTVVELTPQEGADKNVYVGALTLDPKTPAGETTLSIGALRAEPVEVKFDPKKADPLQEFVRRLDDMRAEKPYQYDPRIMAGENRIDLKLTVLAAKQGTAAAVPSTPKK